MQARILWVYQEELYDFRGRLLYRQMQHEHLNVDMIPRSELRNYRLDGVDLVLIEAFDPFEDLLQTAVISIRFKSRVPLVLLTNGFSSRELVNALLSGVDALWSCQSSVRVLMARCKAILRRWRWNLRRQTNLSTVVGYPLTNQAFDENV